MKGLKYFACLELGVGLNRIIRNVRSTDTNENSINEQNDTRKCETEKEKIYEQAQAVTRETSIQKIMNNRPYILERPHLIASGYMGSD